MSLRRLTRLPPLALAAMLYALGAAFAIAPGARPIPIALTFAAAAACALLAMRGRGLPLVAWFLVGMCATAVAVRDRAEDCRFAIEDGARIAFRGTLTTAAAADGDATLRMEDGGASGCVADVRARLGRGVATPPAPGAELRGHGRWLAAGYAPRDPRWAGTLFIDGLEVVAEAGSGHHPLLALRGAAQARVRELFGERAPVVEALVLARTESLDPAVRERFARAGLAHLLAISGMHVGLLAGLLIAAAAAAGASPAAGSLVAIGVTALYVLFIGAPAAAARAAFMLFLLFAARLLQRPARASSILAAAGVALVAWQPTILVQPGFQLSFAGVAGLIGLSAPVARLLPVRTPRRLRDAIAGGVAATLATAPICALHFQQIAPVGVLANLVAVPALALAVPAIGLALALSLVSGAAGAFVAGGAGVLVSVLDRTARAAAALPYGHAHVTADLAVALVLAAFVAAAVWSRAAAPMGPGRGVRPHVRRLGAAGVALAVLLVWPAAAQRAGNGALEIHMIDVGQGDAIALRTPNGAWALIDAGPRTAGWDAGARRVAPYLLRHGVRRLEALIVTHPDADHIGGALAVEERIAIVRIVDPGMAFGRDMHTALLADAADDHRLWLAGAAGRSLEIDGVVLEFLHPTPQLDDGREANDLSVVIRLQWRDFSALLTGDAGADVEHALIERNPGRLRVDVLKVGHHGSSTSTTQELLDAARPSVALIPVGRGNRYGHPDAGVVRRLRDAGIRVLRTDLHGDVVLRIEPDGLPRIWTSRADPNDPAAAGPPGRAAAARGVAPRRRRAARRALGARRRRMALRHGP